MTRIVVADDHPLLRRGLLSALEALDGVTVVAEAGDGEAAMRAIAQERPDIAVLDIAMPNGNGLDVAAWVKANAPSVALVLITNYPDAAFVERAIELGVCGYLLKTSAIEELPHCLAAAENNGRYLSPAFVTAAPAAPPVLDDADTALLARLTKTQREVLKHLAAYKTSKEIARAMGVSFRTVQNHRARIARSLGFEGKHRVLEFAVRNADRL